MNAEHERELRDLLSKLTYRKRHSYDPRERYVVLKRWGTVQHDEFGTFSDALSFAKGYVNGPHDSPACAFVVDTDPEFATAHVVSHRDSTSTIDLRSEIKNLYDGFVDGEKYAENLIEKRRSDHLLAAKHAADQQQASRLLLAMVVVGVLLLYFLFGR